VCLHFIRHDLHVEIRELKHPYLLSLWESTGDDRGGWTAGERTAAAVSLSTAA
jgi:hypothetical protein